MALAVTSFRTAASAKKEIQAGRGVEAKRKCCRAVLASIDNIASPSGAAPQRDAAINCRKFERVTM